MDYEKRVQDTVRGLVRRRAVESSHDVGEGGLALALAESCFAGRMGADVRLASDLAAELLIFHEGPSRILVSTSDPARIIEAARSNGVQAVTIGVTLESRLVIRNRDQVLIDTSVPELFELWRSAFENLLHNPVLV
jgi:phosphoribosylformylglycinamidine synthase